MRARVLLCLCLLVLLPAAVVSAQSAATGAPAIATFLSSTGDSHTSRTLVVDNIQPNAVLNVVLFDPQGGQAVVQGQADSSGELKLQLQPPGGTWILGLYRAVVGLASGQSVSATFPVTDGKPELYAGPGLPSPTSAFLLTGTGFSANQSLNLVLSLAGDYGDRSFQVLTDASGSFSTFVWPEEYGYAFWSAGGYQLTAPVQGISITFWVREHPSASYLTVTDPVTSTQPAQISYVGYGAGRYLWTVFADASGRTLGEFLLGPSDASGNARDEVQLSANQSGQYLLATPYDWGETSFSIVAPTAKPTSTPQSTATATPGPTATRTPKPTPTRTPKSAKKRKVTPTPTRTSKHRACTKHTKRRKIRCRM